MKPIVITIESPIVAAYLRALIESATLLESNLNRTLRERINMSFPGGFEAAKAHSEEFEGERYEIWVGLNDALKAEGITTLKAPWFEAALLKPWDITFDELSLEQAKLVAQGKCPFCKEDINPEADFKDAPSLGEYKISGLCQQCQDSVFAEPDE